MQILIIGGTGVLSSAITEVAIKNSIKITMINRGNHSIPQNVELIKSDRRNFDYIKKSLQGRTFDAVMDFLCYSDKDTEESVRFYSNYTRQYFFISSCAVYDTRKMGGRPCCEEDVKSLAIWDYSVNKWRSEQKVYLLFKNLDCKYTIIRPCVTYGNTRIPYGISPRYRCHWTLIARILEGKPIIRWNGGNNRCNMTRVEDFAVGVVGLIGNEKAYNEAFNVCGEETPTWNDVLSIISKTIGKEIKTIDIPRDYYAKELPSRKGEILGGRSIDAIMDNKKIKSAVQNFRQTIFIEEGIKRTIEAYKHNNYEEGIDWRFDADTDRIITKWCKLNKISVVDLNLKYIDYLNNAGLNEKIIYWLEKNKDYVIIRLVDKIFAVLRKIWRKLS